ITRKPGPLTNKKMGQFMEPRNATTSGAATLSGLIGLFVRLTQGSSFLATLGLRDAIPSGLNPRPCTPRVSGIGLETVGNLPTAVAPCLTVRWQALILGFS